MRCEQTVGTSDQLTASQHWSGGRENVLVNNIQSYECHLLNLQFRVYHYVIAMMLPEMCGGQMDGFVSQLL